MQTARKSWGQSARRVGLLMHVESILFPGGFYERGQKLSMKQALMGYCTYHNQERILAKIRSRGLHRLVMSTYFAS